MNLKGSVDPSLFKILKHNNQYPFLILDRSPMHISVYKRNNTYSENNTHNDRNTNRNETSNTDIFENLIDIMQQTLNLLEEQKQSRNVL